MIVRMIEHSGKPYSVEGAHSTDEALERIGGQHYNLYLLDFCIPDIGGLELCKRIRQIDPKARVVFYTGITSQNDRAMALYAGADVVLSKPRDLENLVPTISRLLKADSEEVLTGDVPGQFYFH